MASYSLPNLPYAYDALEPFVDAMTMEIHHSKHHQTYVNNLNAALEKAPELAGLDLLALNKAVGTGKVPDSVATAVRNNGGGHWNHTFFWQVMGKPGDNNGPSAELKSAIDASFGSLDKLKSDFGAAAAGRFGSGWAWLGVKPDGSLTIGSTPNQDNPLMSLADQAFAPILGLDVWYVGVTHAHHTHTSCIYREHAYYLKYQNRRPEYIAAWWNVVNWDTVNTFYKDAASGAKL